MIIFNGAGAPPPARTYADASSRLASRREDAWPQALSHRFVDSIEKRHCRQAALRARFGLTAFANCAGKLDVLAIECRDAVERHFLAVAVGHRIAVHLVGFFLADVAIETAEWALVIERHREREKRPFLRLH